MYGGARNKVLRRSRWLLLMIYATGVQAADWNVNPGVSVGGVYTSNVDLAPTDERDDKVIVITPGVDISGEGRRVLFNGAYRAQGLMYMDNTSANDVFHEVVADGTGALAEDMLFIDFRARRGSINIDNTGPVAIDNINVTDNLAEAWFYGIAPRAEFRFGGVALLNAQVGRDWVRWDDNQVSDSEADRVSASIQSGENAARLRWNLNYSFDDVSFDDEGDDTKFINYRAQLDYRLRQGWSLLAGVGYEDNEYESQDDTSGSSWDLGLRWAPNDRIALDFTLGERYFGPARRLSWEYRSRRTTITAGYREDPQLARNFVGNSTSVAPDAAPPPIGDIRTDTPTQSDQVFIRKRGDADVTFDLRRGRLRFAGFGENRDFQQGDDEEVFGLSGLWQWRFTRQTIADVSGGWQRTDFGDSTRQDNLWNAVARLTHNLGRRVQGVVEVRYRDNDSNEQFNEYNEFRVAAGLRLTFGIGEEPVERPEQVGARLTPRQDGAVR